MTSGTYRIIIGDVFYIGSSTNLRRRRFDHQWRLRSGVHPSKKLNATFQIHGEFSWVVTDFLKRNKGESDTDFRDRLCRAEQRRLNEVKDDPNLANVSMNSRGPDSRDDARRRWQDPEFRAYMSARLRGRTVSPETKAKQSAAKRGGKNPHARAVEVTTPDGTTVRFPCASDAAAFFEVKQQVFDLWIKGAWPSERSRFKNQWVAAYSAKFVKSLKKDATGYVI